MNEILTRSERNIVAHVFAEFLFNPLSNFYPGGVDAVLRQARVLTDADPQLKRDEVTVAYEAQLRDLLFLSAKIHDPDEVPSATAFDIAVKYGDSFVFFEVNFLTGWKPAQVEQELSDCKKIEAATIHKTNLVLLYPSWRRPKLPRDLKSLTWEQIEKTCRAFRGEETSQWMRSISVPQTIRNHGTFGKLKGLFSQGYYQAETKPQVPDVHRP